jgi:CheY-like chemotaxis protein
MPQPGAAPILIVEDNPETRLVLERVLRISGYDVVAARDGMDGLAYLRRGGRVSVVVLDIEMPRMDGVGFRRALSADPRLAGIPVIVYTAAPHREVPDVFAVFRKGSDDPDRLLEFVARATQARSSARVR